MRTLTITTLQPLPSMNEDVERIKAASYTEAVVKTIKSWQKTQRRTSLHVSKNTTYWYHTIKADGTFQDRNMNSGVPKSGEHTLP